MRSKAVVVRGVIALTLALAGGVACKRSLALAPCPCLTGWSCCPPHGGARGGCYPADVGCPGAGEEVDARLDAQLDAQSMSTADTAVGVDATDGANADWLNRADIPADPIINCGRLQCPVGGVRCCYVPDTGDGYCMGGTATCAGIASSRIKTLLACDDGGDCPVNQICCHSSVYTESFTSCMNAVDCVDQIVSSPGFSTFRKQVCDPNRTPPECLAGTCRPANTTASVPPDFPPTLHFCRP